MAKKEKLEPASMYESVAQADVPHGRNGKHKNIVTELLYELAQLDAGQALKVRLSQLPDTKENIRSALNRATRQQEMNVATSTDANYLYIWKRAERGA